MRILIIGCGYIGVKLAKVLIRQGHEVVGTRRSAEGLLVLDSNNIPSLQLDITEPEQLNSFQEDFDWVVNCAAAPHSTVAHYTSVYYQGTANVLNWLRRHNVKKYVYTSSTGVYGQNDGSIVTEESPIFSNTDTGKILVSTEELITKICRAYPIPAVILRVSGIYGEERGYYFKQFINGQAVIHGNGTRFLNMIHSDDVVGAILLALEKGVIGNVYNVVDNEPVMEIDFYKGLSELLKKPMPPVIEKQETGSRLATSNKRVSNVKLREKLGYNLKYPTFREGYRSVIKDYLARQMSQT